MRVLTYQGDEWQVPFRHPELFTQLAPERFQEACLTHGGRPIGTDKPRFRLAAVDSRYQLVGGSEVTELDSQGNYRSRKPEELFIPKYRVEDHQRGWYILEIWRSAQWHYEQRADTVAVEYTENGQSYRKMEPIWADGAYRGLEWKVGQPFVFRRDTPLDSCGGISIRWALYSALKSLEFQVDYEQELKRGKQELALQREKDKQLYKDTAREHRSRMFAEPTVSYAGIDPTVQ